VFYFRLCLFLQTKCRLCFLSSNNRWADVSKPVATVNSSSDGQMTLAHLSLLWTTVAISVFDLSLLSYYCSDEPIAHDHSDLRPIATVSNCSSDKSTCRWVYENPPYNVSRFLQFSQKQNRMCRSKTCHILPPLWLLPTFHPLISLVGDSAFLRSAISPRKSKEEKHFPHLIKKQT
jgi:hypothetical protein